MSLSIKNRATSLIVLLLGLLLLASQVACSPTQRDGVHSLAEAFSQEIDKTLEDPSDLVFAGQVADDADKLKTMKEQATSTLAKVRLPQGKICSFKSCWQVDHLLREAGSDRKHILSATIYVKDMKV